MQEQNQLERNLEETNLSLDLLINTSLQEPTWAEAARNYFEENQYSQNKREYFL